MENCIDPSGFEPKMNLSKTEAQTFIFCICLFTRGLPFQLWSAVQQSGGHRLGES